jgi:hypothetical protein
LSNSRHARTRRASLPTPPLLAFLPYRTVVLLIAHLRNLRRLGCLFLLKSLVHVWYMFKIVGHSSTSNHDE